MDTELTLSTSTSSLLQKSDSKGKNKDSSMSLELQNSLEEQREGDKITLGIPQRKMA